MITPPKYKTRTIEYLTERIRIAQNRLQMRDWLIDLDYGDSVPENFQDYDNDNAVARCEYSSDLLKAYIWISPKRCKKENADPVFILYHEIGHLFHEVHNEEVRCNILASLL